MDYNVRVCSVKATLFQLVVCVYRYINMLATQSVSSVW